MSADPDDRSGRHEGPLPRGGQTRDPCHGHQRRGGRQHSAIRAWALFDYLVEPSSAPDVLWLRIGFTVPIIALLLLGLIFTKAGRRHPELFVLGMMSSVDLGIALMIAQVDTHYAAYALGHVADGLRRAPSC